MAKLRKYVVVHAFSEILPGKSDFSIIEEYLPKLRLNEFLVETKFISVDPYMWSYAKEFQLPYDQFGFQVGKVTESRNRKYPTGVYVVSHSGWRDYVILNGDPDEMFKMKPYIPDVGNLPISLAIGALGMPGITAYLGFLEICKPKKGETVCVTGAAGAVGSLVGQIARIMNCTVIGFTGSDRKVRILKEDLGYHHAFNYKTEDIKDVLKSAIPDGIDCYFDNVGGDLATIIMEHMNEHGRVATCGAISTYGLDSVNQKPLKSRVSIQIESFSFTQWNWSKQSDALKQLKQWLQKGCIKAKETVAYGFEELPDTFVAMLKGDSVGKAVVKL